MGSDSHFYSKYFQNRLSEGNTMMVKPYFATLGMNGLNIRMNLSCVMLFFAHTQLTKNYVQQSNHTMSE